MTITDLIAEGHLQTDDAYDEGQLIPADDPIALRAALIQCGYDIPLLSEREAIAQPSIKTERD